MLNGFLLSSLLWLSLVVRCGDSLFGDLCFHDDVCVTDVVCNGSSELKHFDREWDSFDTVSVNFVVPYGLSHCPAAALALRRYTSPTVF